MKNTRKTKSPAIKIEVPRLEMPKLEMPKVQAPKPVPPKVNRVCFELMKPDARNVFVVGSFNGWKPEATPLVRAENGKWVRDLTVDPGRYEYLFVVDGQWLPDPNAKESVANPFGGKNSVMIVSE